MLYGVLEVRVSHDDVIRTELVSDVILNDGWTNSKFLGMIPRAFDRFCIQKARVLRETSKADNP